MKKIQKIMLGVFCGGVLLTGIGTGVAVVEFSSLAYGGERMIGETRMETKTLEAEIDPDAGVWHLSDSYPWSAEISMQTDESVPENTVRLVVTYNEARFTPEVQAAVYTDEYVDENGDTVEEKYPVLELYGIWKDQDEMKLFMEVKDQFLADLKEGKLPSFREPEYVERVEILVNPANEDDVEFF